jgi:hypothetical protein
MLDGVVVAAGAGAGCDGGALGPEFRSVFTTIGLRIVPCGGVTACVSVCCAAAGYGATAVIDALNAAHKAIADTLPARPLVSSLRMPPCPCSPSVLAALG